MMVPDVVFVLKQNTPVHLLCWTTAPQPAMIGVFHVK
jgi:hypothetical protein